MTPGLGFKNGRCMSAGQVVSPEAAAAAAAAVSVAVGAAVAAGIAGGVAGGVAGGAGGGGTGGAGGAEGGGGGGGGAMALIGHVQMLNMVGRVGGENGSDSMAAFSDGFGWANLDMQFSIFGRDTSARRSSNRRTRRESRRASKKSQNENTNITFDLDANSTNIDEGNCSWESVAPPVEKIVLCVMILLAVFCTRSLLVVVVEKCFKKEAQTALLFPLWEGPLLLAQYLAICDSTFEAIDTYCPLGVSIGGSVLMFGPLLVMISVLVYLRPHINQKGHELFEVLPKPPPFSTILKKLYSTPGIFAKWALYRNWKDRAYNRGSWDNSDPKIRRWSWLIGDYMGSAWLFCIWSLSKRIWISGATTLFD